MGVSRGGAGRRACVSAENTTPFVAASWKLQLQLYCLVWIKTWAASLKENHTCERSRSNYGAQFIPVTFSLILKRKVLLFFSFGEQKVKGATFLNPRKVSVWSIFSFFPHWCSCGQEKKIWIVFPCIRRRCCQCQVLVILPKAVSGWLQDTSSLSTVRGQLMRLSSGRLQALMEASPGCSKPVPPCVEHFTRSSTLCSSIRSCLLIVQVIHAII